MHKKNFMLTEILYLHRLFQSKILNFAMIGFHQISLSAFIRNFTLYRNVKKFKKFEQFPKFSKQNFQKQQGYYQQHKCYFKTGTKFLRRFFQKISSPQTNKQANILTNDHPDTMLIFCFLSWGIYNSKTLFYFLTVYLFE